MSEPVYPRYHFLGVDADALTKSDMIAVIDAAIESQTSNSIIGNHNLHSLYLFARDAGMRRFYSLNRYTHIDGMSLVVLGRLLGIPLKREHRAAYLDWFDEFLAAAQRKSWRVYFLGGSSNVAEGVRAKLAASHPGLEFRSHHGFDAFSSDTLVYQEIREFSPDVLLVGMGMPLQENWILQALDKVDVKVILPCGGIMDFRMGVQKPAPRWTGQICMEWLYRLAHRPRELFGRYLIEPAAMIPFILKELRQNRGHVKDLRQSGALGERDHPNSQPARAAVESSAECS